MEIEWTNYFGKFFLTIVFVLIPYLYITMLRTLGGNFAKYWEKIWKMF